MKRLAVKDMNRPFPVVRNTSVANSDDRLPRCPELHAPACV